MHIPQAMLHGSICPVSAAISVGVIGVAAAAMAKSRDQRCTPMNFALTTALIFAGQMLNFPISGGTSGHLLGGVLAVLLLGLPGGILSLALTVTLQCLFFADGGLDVLGVNVLNMAVIGAGVGGWLLQTLLRRGDHGWWRYAAIFGAAWVSVVLAALAVAVELAVAETIPLARVLPAMLGVHMAIGLGEGLISVAVTGLLRVPEVSGRRLTSFPVTGLVLLPLAALVAPFACGSPDGLEWVADKMSFLKVVELPFVAPMPDYALPAVKSGLLSQWAAAAAGIGLALAVAYLVGLGLRSWAGAASEK